MSEVKSWLKTVLVNEHLSDFSVNHVEKSKAKNGYVGDIVYVKISGKTESDVEKEYNLVLKCGKASQSLRDTLPVRETYKNEIYVYSKVFPAFAQFQLEKGWKEVFDSIPKCYGTVIEPKMEVIVFDNLATLGFKLYDRKKPLTIDHINLVVTEYGKFHAISAAMQDQDPEMYTELASGVQNLFLEFEKRMDLQKFFGAPIDEVYELVKGDIGQNAAEKLKQLKDQVAYALRELVKDKNDFSVIVHGDAWNNNFMFKYEEVDDNKPIQVAVLDWQISRVGSPVADLSYFLYSCISREDLKNFDDILKKYYDSFANYLKKLGSDPEKIFPYNQLLSDWKVFAKFGIIMAFVAAKLAASDEDEVTDFAETIESGGDFNETFMFDSKNVDVFKNRVLHVVEHIIERGLI